MFFKLTISLIERIRLYSNKAQQRDKDQRTAKFLFDDRINNNSIKTKKKKNLTAASYLRPWELLIFSFMLMVWRRRLSIFLKYVLLFVMLFTALWKKKQINEGISTLNSGILQTWHSMRHLTCRHTPQCRWILDSAPPSPAYQSSWEMTENTSIRHAGQMVDVLFNYDQKVTVTKPYKHKQMQIEKCYYFNYCEAQIYVI